MSSPSFSKTVLDYLCTHPGCNKSFKRSDHLTRHEKTRRSLSTLGMEFLLMFQIWKTPNRAMHVISAPKRMRGGEDEPLVEAWSDG